MANSDKNIKITPNINQSGQPVMVYTGSGNVPIALKVLDDSYGTLSFEGSAGQLFSLNNNLSSGTIFSVNDISGMPQFDVNADGTIRVAPYGSGVYMGGVGGGTFTIQPSAKSSSGAGTSVAITAGNGVTSGAGGSLILQAGIQATTGGDGKVVVKQTTGQTSNLQEWQNSSGSALAYLDTTGRITVPYIDVINGTYSASSPAIRLNTGTGFYYSNPNIYFCAGNNSQIYMAPAAGNLMVNVNGQPGSTSGQITVRPGNGGGAQVNCLIVQQNPNQGSSLLFSVTGHGSMTVAPDVPSVSCATLNGSAAYSMTATTKALTSNVATITVSGGTPRVDIGDTIVVALSPADPVFDGTYTISAKSGNNLSYARTNVDVASTATAGTVSSTATATLQNINIGVPGAKGSVIKAAASQTANLQEWQNSSSTVLASVDSSGMLFATSAKINTYTNISKTYPVTFGSAAAAYDYVAFAEVPTQNGAYIFEMFLFDGAGGGSCAAMYKFVMYYQPSTAWQILLPDTYTGPRGASNYEVNVARSTTTNNLKIRLRRLTAAGGTAINAYVTIITYNGLSSDIQFADSGNDPSALSIIYTSPITNYGGSFGLNTQVPDAYFHIKSSSTTKKGQIIQAVASQTANLQEWQNSSSGILTSIDPTGGINLYPYGASAGNTNSIKFLELAANGSHSVGFKAADTIPSNVTWTLPSGDGSTGQALVTNGSGLLSWATAGGGGGTGTVTSVSGTGSVNGLTLTGTVTNSGSLTLGGTLSNISLITAVSGILPIANGGTNLSSVGSANQILGVSPTGSVLEYKTLTPGSGISISNTVGSITINSSGLTANGLTIGNGLTGGSFNGSSATTINVNSSGYSNTTTGTTSSYDLGTSSFVKANPSTSGLTINGFSSSGSYDGRNVKLVNVSNYNITIVNTGTTVCVGGNNIVLGSKDAAELILDSGASVWRVF